MRVLYLSKACVVGAYQRKLEELAGNPDLDLVAVVPPFWNDSANRLPLERLHTQGYELVVEEARFNGHFHCHYYSGLGRQLDRVRPDLFHVDEEPYNLATFHAVWLARRRGIATLFFTWQNLHRRYPPPFSWMERFVFRDVQGAIAGNREAMDVLRAKGFTKPIRVIPQFGVDPERYCPADAPSQTRRAFTIGFAGRLVEEKGLLVLLDAVRHLVGDWRLRILGRGPLEPTIRRYVRERGLGKNVSLEGTFPSGQMPGFYRQLDALVLPSLTRRNWKEQFGRVLIEAMACSVPVIGSDSGEIPHVIGDAGLIFPEGDANALSAHLTRLWAAAEERREIGQRGRQRVLERFTHAQVAHQTAETYRSLFQ